MIDELDQKTDNAQATGNLSKLTIGSNGTGVVIQASTTNSDGDSINALLKNIEAQEGE